MKTLILVGALVSSFAFAATDFVPIQERAQGQSLTGAQLANDSIFSNPASSAFSQVYSIDGTFLMPKSFAVSVLDTKTSGIGGGLGYFRQGVTTSASPLQGARLALNSKVSGNVGVGVVGKAVWGPDAVGNGNDYKDVDAGVMTNLGMVQLGATVRNVFGGKTEMNQEREAAVGGRIGYSETLFFSVASQAKLSNLSPYQYGFGAEYLSPYYFALKGGYRFQPSASLSYWSTGISLVSPRVSLHYAVEFPNQPGESTEHVLGTTLLF